MIIRMVSVILIKQLLLIYTMDIYVILNFTWMWHRRYACYINYQLLVYHT